MLPPRIRLDKRGNPKSVIRSQAHLRFVREHHCSVGCPGLPIDAAHVRVGTDGGTGMKPSDIWTISLCHEHHAESHRIGELAFERRYNLDLKALAAEFAAKSPALRRLKLFALLRDTRGPPSEDANVGREPSAEGKAMTSSPTQAAALLEGLVEQAARQIDPVAWNAYEFAITTHGYCKEGEVIRRFVNGQAQARAALLSAPVKAAVTALMEERDAARADEQAWRKLADDQRAERAALLRRIEDKAREWAAHYDQGSDGRNTFVMFAEWIKELKP